MPKVIQQTSDFQTSSSIISKSLDYQERIISSLYRQGTEAQRSEVSFANSHSCGRAKAEPGLMSHMVEQIQVIRPQRKTHTAVSTGPPVPPSSWVIPSPSLIHFLVPVAFRFHPLH